MKKKRNFTQPEHKETKNLLERVILSEIKEKSFIFILIKVNWGNNGILPALIVFRS